MSYEIKTGAVLIRENTLLPPNFGFKSESCVPGWKVVTDLDGYALDRKIRKAGWTFFCIATVVKATVFGINGQKMVRRAIERILRHPKLERFNSLEIEGVGSVGSARFPGIAHVTVSAKPRHIQQSLFLSVNDLPGSDAMESLTKENENLGTSNTLRAEDGPKQPDERLEEIRK